MSREQDNATKAGTDIRGTGGPMATMTPTLGSMNGGQLAAANYRPGAAPQGRFGGGGMLGSVNSANYSNIHPGARSMVFDQSFGGQGTGQVNNNAGQKIQMANDYMNRNRGFAPTGGADLMSGVAVGRGPAMNPVEEARLRASGQGMMGSRPQAPQVIVPTGR